MRRRIEELETEIRLDEHRYHNEQVHPQLRGADNVFGPIRKVRCFSPIKHAVVADDSHRTQPRLVWNGYRIDESDGCGTIFECCH